MLRSRANTIEGGTTEVNKNVLGERVLGPPARARSVPAAPWRDDPAQLTRNGLRNVRVVERERSGRLAGVRPARRGQRDGRAHDAPSSRPRGASSTDDPAVRVIVNTGEGRAFQTGLDVGAAQPGSRSAARAVPPDAATSTLRLTAWHNDVWKPVIAAVNGVCAGGGLHFVADADIVIAATDATFLDPHVSVGQASVYETIALPKKSPMEAVLRMAFIGRRERMTAARAVRAGHRAPGRRPARAAPRRGAGARGEDRAAAIPTRWPRPSAHSGTHWRERAA